jgi:superfamily I DNA/RNA helicase
MPVLEAVQTFADISNENEFYSHHYPAEVFKGDKKTTDQQRKLLYVAISRAKKNACLMVY